MADQLRALYADGRALIEAELAYQQSRLRYAGIEARRVGLLIGAGLVFLAGVLLALLLGALLMLAPRIGAGPATLVVAFGSLGLAGFSLWLAAQRVKRLGAFLRASATPDSPAGAGDK